jgi:hypothetical protein
MRLSNDCFVIVIGTRNFTERYYRTAEGWVKTSARGRRFRMTAEQVLNHLLPAFAGLRTNLSVRVEYRGLTRLPAVRKFRDRSAARRGAPGGI